VEEVAILEGLVSLYVMVWHSLLVPRSYSSQPSSEAISMDIGTLKMKVEIEQVLNMGL